MTDHTRRKVLIGTAAVTAAGALSGTGTAAHRGGHGGRGASRHRHDSAAGRGGARGTAPLPLPDA